MNLGLVFYCVLIVFAVLTYSKQDWAVFATTYVGFTIFVNHGWKWGFLFVSVVVVWFFAVEIVPALNEAYEQRRNP